MYDTPKEKCRSPQIVIQGTAKSLNSSECKGIHLAGDTQ